MLRVTTTQIITTFIRWLLKMGYIQENPLDRMEKPKRAIKLLPSVTEEQVETLLNRVDNLRDRAILYLLLDSSMRLNELSNIR
ncbi:Tyrosine recombinase XerC [subsurface metagenome]|jgi:site-specific recombinase XerC